MFNKFRAKTRKRNFHRRGMNSLAKSQRRYFERGLKKRSKKFFRDYSLYNL